LQVDVSARAFDGLISRAAVRAHRGVFGHGDFIVHRNVADVHDIDADAVAFLPWRWMLFNVAYIRLPAAEQPMISDVNLPANRHRSRRPAPHNDVSGAGLHLQIHRPGHSKSFLEMSL